MLISKNMLKALNQQVGNEFGASLQYVMVASYFDRDGLEVLASHFYRQSEEEREHALKLVQYISDTGGVVAIPSIEAGKPDFSSAEEAIRSSLDWELRVTKQINDLVDQANKESDHLTRGFLQWFVDEQLEEVSSMQGLLNLVRQASSVLEVEMYLARRAPAAGTEEEAG